VKTAHKGQGKFFVCGRYVSKRLKEHSVAVAKKEFGKRRLLTSLKTLANYK